MASQEFADAVTRAQRALRPDGRIYHVPVAAPVMPEIHVGTRVRVDHEQLGQFFGRVIKVMMSDTNVPNVEVQAENNGSGGAIYRVPSTCCTPKPEPVFAHTIPREWITGATAVDYNEGYSTEGYSPPTERTLASQDQALATLARQIEQQRQIIKRQNTTADRLRNVNETLRKTNNELRRENARLHNEAKAAARNMEFATTAFNRAKASVFAAMVEDDADEEF